MYQSQTMKTLEVLFLDELAGMYDAERRIAGAWPKLIKPATCSKLQTALDNHLEKTKEQVARLEQVFRSIGEEAGGKICQAAVGLLKESDEIIAEFKGSPAINAAVIAAAQKIGHYEIASYGCLREWANILDHGEATEALDELLEQEKTADKALTILARSGKNDEACGVTSRMARA